MRPQTYSLRERVRSAENVKRQLQLLRDAYQGEDAYIISCGPSTAEVWSVEVENFLSDKLVIGIKQAFDLRPQIFDFHVINMVHEKHYAPADCAIRIRTTEICNCADIFLSIPDPNNYNRCLAVTRDYDRWRLDRTEFRPWGVGVMHEVGIYLPVLFGCRSLTVIGWDLGGQHFYDASQSTPLFETQLIVDSMPSLVEWMDEAGCPIQLCSPKSCLPIKQILPSALATTAWLISKETILHDRCAGLIRYYGCITAQTTYAL